MLRSTLRHAGGVRIDHVMGLARLWVVPGRHVGGPGRLCSLSRSRTCSVWSKSNRAAIAPIVLGEDLGTLPDGFRERLQDAGLAGLRVCGSSATECGSCHRRNGAMTRSQ